MFQDIFLCEYHSELLETLVNASVRSGIANIASMIVFAMVTYTYIPFSILLAWILIHLTLLSLRLFYKNRLHEVVHASQEIIRPVLRKNIIVISLGGVFWGLTSVLAITYTPIEIQFFSLFLLLGINSGVIATLSPVFRAFALFFIPSMGLQFLAFLYVNDKIHYLIAFMLAIYGFIVFSATYSVFARMRESIEIKEKMRVSEEALAALNRTLEERVLEESSKNVAHTQHIFQQSRLAQMGEMLSMIAHQWRQPLTSISASASSLEVDLLMDECDRGMFKKHIHRIASLSQHLSSTIDDFRGFFKENKLREYVEIEEVIESSLQITKGSLETNGIEVIKDFSETPAVFIVANELRQVILNLVKNAEDVMVHNKIQKPKLWIKTYESSAYVLLSIEDNGGGINESVINKVFEPYFTTKENLNGTGLGLYMSKTIVEEHFEGMIDAENGEQGAKFIISLPIKHEESSNDTH